MNVVEWMQTKMRLSSDYQPRIIAVLAAHRYGMATFEMLVAKSGIDRAIIRKYPLKILEGHGVIRKTVDWDSVKERPAWELVVDRLEDLPAIREEALKCVRKYKRSK